jgi:hypothetical protein
LLRLSPERCSRTTSLGADIRASPRRHLLKQKVATIQLGAKSAGQLRRTTVTQDEVNACFALDAHNDLPVGVVEPSVTILGTGRLSGRAVVDLDAVRRSKNPTVCSIRPRISPAGCRSPPSASSRPATASGGSSSSRRRWVVSRFLKRSSRNRQLLFAHARQPGRRESR